MPNTRSGAIEQEEEEMQPDLSDEQQAASFPPTTPTDMLSLVKWIEETRLAEDERRRREDQARFEALLKLINPERQPAHSPPEHLAASDDIRHRQPPLPPPTQKATAQTPPPLKPDATYQLFREWKRRWQDYATMVDLYSLPHEKQLIQLRMCLTLETQRVLEHTLQIPPSTDKTVDEVVAALEVHIKGLRNEAIRRRGLLSCRQMEGETFADFYVRLRRSAEEIDICPGKSPICEETQLKSVIIMGVRDDELIQRLISLDDKCSLQDMVNTCRSYEAARCATSDIRAQPAQVRALTHHQRRKKQKSFLRQTPKQPISKATDPCQCCARHHEPGACLWLRLPAATVVGRDTFLPRSNVPLARPSAASVPVSVTSTLIASRRLVRNTSEVFQYLAVDMFRNTRQPHSRPAVDHCKALAIIPKEFPKPILEVKHVKKCVELPFSASTPPSDVKEYFLKEFKDVLVAKAALQSTPLKPMVGSPMRIHLKDNAVPFAIHTPRQIPLAFRDHVKDELESMVSQGIIRPAGDEPSEWCHPLVAVAKPNGGVRITTDLSKLNAQVARPPHPSPTPFDAQQAMPTAYEVTLHCKVSRIASKWWTTSSFTMPTTPLTLPASTKSSPDVVNLASPLIRKNLRSPRLRWIFCGFTLSVAGIAADQDKVIAIRDFPTPANLTDLRSFMGLVNQLAEFTPEISAAAQPLRPLMSPKRQFLWTPDHDEAFRRVKAALIDPPILASFDPTLQTILQTDASRLNGIGFALLQDHGSGRLRLIQCGSRFLTEAETRYATIELELLAAVWAMFKCKYYLMGLQNFTLMTDHRPLVPILNSYTLDAVENPRLQRLKEKVSPYIFTAVWRAGKDLRIPDALSRAPVSYPAPEDHTLCTDSIASLHTIATVRAVTESHVDEDRTLEELRDSARTDPDYVQLHRCVTSGFPSDRYALPRPLLPYWKIRDNLHADGDLVLYGMRIVVPNALRRRILARLHDSHRGVEATKRRAGQTVFWPGINSDIANTVQSCEPCQYLQPSQQKEPILSDDHPTRPFESVSADFFSVAGKSFLVIADRLSGWPVVVPCKGDTTSSNTIRMFCNYFREVGVPLRLRTDGGPQFTSQEFRSFAARWGVRHIVTSPHYPQSNGHAEAAVKAIKHLILKVAPSGNIDCEEFDRGLLELRNTPNFTGRSPAQVLYGHPLRSCVPAHPDAFSTEWQTKAEECDRRAATQAKDAAARYDSHARELSRLYIGQHVRLQDPKTHRWDKVGIVMRVGKARTYEIRTTSGRVLQRNRHFLRPVTCTPSHPHEAHSEDPPADLRRSKRLQRRLSARD
ncbi:uncharacterized protein LOC143023062 [Oratosquilla oratoria]|uniref:uncharacterized protein LOC143023062 n=1 Tax=Oratosquilla oratoria TaxID=337810 RepID=UPI003F7634FF